MKRKINLMALVDEKLTSEEQNEVNGGVIVIGGRKWAWDLQGWCWCGSYSCGNEGNAVDKAHGDKNGDYSA